MSLARNGGRFSSIAFDPTFIIDRDDPELAKRWPKGFMGLFWSAMTVVLAKPPPTAGEPIADLMLIAGDHDLNGARYVLSRRKAPDRVMSDVELGRRLWEQLTLFTSHAGPAAAPG